MADVLKSDIFFFVTTILVVIIAIVVVVLAVYGIRILSDIKYVSKKVKEESDEFIHDAREMRMKLKEKGNSLLGLISVIFGSKSRRKKD